MKLVLAARAKALFSPVTAEPQYRNAYSLIVVTVFGIVTDSRVFEPNAADVLFISCHDMLFRWMLMKSMGAIFANLR
jgi:hypothetical protein